jgi:hypothetical protein
MILNRKMLIDRHLTYEKYFTKYLLSIIYMLEVACVQPIVIYLQI